MAKRTVDPTNHPTTVRPGGFGKIYVFALLAICIAFTVWFLFGNPIQDEPAPAIDVTGQGADTGQPLGNISD